MNEKCSAPWRIIYVYKIYYVESNTITWYIVVKQKKSTRRMKYDIRYRGIQLLIEMNKIEIETLEHRK